MMRSLFAGVSGLRNHQTRMDVIGNNIANVNTVGFKSSRVTFQDMLSQTLQGASSSTGTRGGTNPLQIGMGMGLSSIDTVFTDGSLQPTGKQTDLAITGQGFFVLSDGQNQVYTRAGGFDFDTDGNYLVPGTGYKVMGWKADSNGVVDSSQPATSIQIPVGSAMPAKVTSTVNYVNNLSASATVRGTAASVAAATLAADTSAQAAVTAMAAAVPAPSAALSGLITAAQAATALADTTPTTANINAAATAAQAAAALATSEGTLTTETALVVTDTATAVAAVTAYNDISSDVAASINVYDSQGNAYKLRGTFEKTASNTWSFTPASTVVDSAGVTVANVTPSVTPIVITFNANGTFNSASAATITIDPTGLTPDSPYAGAGAFTTTPKFSTMTQYGGESTAVATAQDGYASGTLNKVTIDATGTIVGGFTNGKSLNMAQVALAVFNNPGGLDKVGENMYAKSNNSGEAQIGSSNTGGRGSFNAGSLEMSNVDLASEFSNMIITQRGFQANSKIISTSDEMLDLLANLKR